MPKLLQGPPDTLTQKIGVLVRREVEARILAPIIEALAKEFGREPVIAIIRDTIVDIARQQGAELADTMGGCSCRHFKESLRYWTKDDALEIDMHVEDGEQLTYHVTRCRYAEMYLALGIPELGVIFSCNRDAALIEGFNPNAKLIRNHTLMEGAPYCDFAYTFPPEEDKDDA